MGGGVVGLGGEGAGLVLVLVRAMVHSAPGGRVVGQLWARVKLVAVSWRLVAAEAAEVAEGDVGGVVGGEGEAGGGGDGVEFGEVGG